MANIKSQIKRIKTNEKARLRNKSVKSELKTYVRRVREAVEAGDKDAALERLKALHAFDDLDVVLYDVLGDVVCGGFAVPIREGYASEIYIVSSGELMSLYAANNIAKGVRRFAERGAVKLGGIIGNGRDVLRERELLEAFAARIGTQLITYIPRSRAVHEAEIHRQTLIAYAPDSEQAQHYTALAQAIDTNEMLTVPTPMEFEELEDLVERYGD